jgi:hypothetical protein
MTDRDKVIQFPLLSMEAMAPEICAADKLFEPALSFRFPPDPSPKLLREARRQVLAYLDWITSDNGMMSEGPDWSVHEIHRACARLIEIAEALPAAVDAESEAALIARPEEKGRDHVPGTPSVPQKTQPKGHDR